MAEEVTIRPARRGDAAAVADLWRRLMDEQTALDGRFAAAADAQDRWRNDYPVWLEDGTCRLLVAEADGGLVGFGRAHRWVPPPVYEETAEVYLDELYVVPAVRRQGVGSRLLKATRAWAEDCGAVRMRLGMLAANGEGRAFWTRHGARPFVETLTLELHPARRPATRAGRLGF